MLISCNALGGKDVARRRSRNRCQSVRSSEIRQCPDTVCALFFKIWPAWLLQCFLYRPQATTVSTSVTQGTNIKFPIALASVAPAGMKGALSLPKQSRSS